MPKKPAPSTVEIGFAGLKHSGGRLNEEFHPRLQGTRAARVYEEMRDNDATVGAILYVIEAYLRRVTWHVKPAGKDGVDPTPAAKEEADFLHSNMHDMEAPWEDFISDCLSFLPFGHSLHEVVYKIRKGRNGTSPRFQSDFDDARIGWRNLALRPQNTIDRWDIQDGRILGCWQKDPNNMDEVYLPMDRCVLFRTKPYKGSPEGRSILRTAYRSWYLKKRLEEVEATGIARDLVGVPVVHMPVATMAANAPAAHVAMRASMERLVSALHRDEHDGFIFPAELNSDGSPTGYKLSLLASPGAKQIPADPVIRRYDSRICMSVAAEFLLLGTEKTGSFALSAQKSINFLKSLEWYVGVIAAALNKGPVKWLYDANNVPVENRASICPGDLDTPDLADLGLFLSQVAAGGFLHPTPKVEARIREIADLPTEEESLQQLFDEEKEAEAEQKALEAEAMSMKAQMVNQQNQPPGEAPTPPAKAPPPPPGDTDE